MTNILKLHLLTTVAVTLMMCFPSGANAAVWAWILTNPAASITGQNNGEGRQHTARSIAFAPSLKHGGTANVDNDDEILRQRHHKHHHHRYGHGHGHGQVQPCLDDETCGRGLFCDRHYGMCMPYRHEGEQCRRDNHCDRGYECIFGRCRKNVRKGEKDSKCRRDSDCVSGCCARVHGESVCKRLLPAGHRCFVPDGGLDYTLNEMCPCEAGLLCKKFFNGGGGGKTISNSNSKEEELSWKPWSENIIYRCAPP